jgi:hypothetical protein
MTLSEIKAEIKSRAKTQCFNEALQGVLAASTEEELIEAGLTVVEWAYQAGIIDDALLSEFTEEKLNAAGIYTTGAYEINDPVGDVYLLKEAYGVITVTGTLKAKIIMMGSATGELTTSNNSHTTVHQYDQSSLEIALIGESIVNTEIRERASCVVNAQDDSLIHIEARGNSQISLELSDDSSALAFMYQNSNLVYSLSDNVSIKFEQLNNSNVINSTPEI